MKDQTNAVLLVDDQKTMVRIMRTLLGQIGFNDVDEAQGGAEALTMMRARKHRLVISDWNMSPMTGLQLLKEIRADPELVNTPFIVVTAEARIDHVVAAKKAGCDGYIVKPFTVQTLGAKIDAVLSFDPTRRHFVQEREAPAVS